MMPLYNVNWRPEAISPYESIWSIRKKFSILNQVNGKKFDIGISELLAKKKILSLEDVDVVSRSKFIASFLGDHKNNFKNTFIDDYLLPKVVVNSKQNINKRLRYCPQCLVEGFHSPIHQINWIGNCPVHLRTLETLDYRDNSLYEWSCRRKVRRQSVLIYENCNLVDQLEEVESYWIWSSRNKWPDPFTNQDLFRIGDYLCWMKKLANTADVWNSDAAWKALGIYQCTNEISNILLSIWREIVPPPSTVEEILQPPVKVREVQKTIFSEPHITNSIDKTIRTFGYKNLQYGLSWNDRIFRRKNILVSVVKRAKEILIGRNKYCFIKKHRTNNLLKGFDDFKTPKSFEHCSFRDAFLTLDGLHKCLLEWMSPGWIIGNWDISKTIGGDLNSYLENNNLLDIDNKNSDLYPCGNWILDIRLLIELFSLHSLVIYIHKKIEVVFPLVQKVDNFIDALCNPYFLVKCDNNSIMIKSFTDPRLFGFMKNISSGGGRKIRKSSMCKSCRRDYKIIKFK